MIVFLLSSEELFFQSISLCLPLFCSSVGTARQETYPIYYFFTPAAVAGADLLPALVFCGATADRAVFLTGIG